MSQGFGQRTGGHEGFGQRPNGGREGLRGIQTSVHFERSQDEDYSASSTGLRRMVIGIGIVALGIGLFVGTRNSTGPSLLDRVWKKDTAPALELYVPVMGKDILLEQVNRECRAKGDAARTKTADSTIRQSGAYVACLASDKPLRLCQMTHRIHMLAALRNYYRLQAAHRDRKLATEAHVAEALQAIVTNGFVPRRDVMAAAEKTDLENVMRGVDTRKSGCGG